MDISIYVFAGHIKYIALGLFKIIRYGLYL